MNSNNNSYQSLFNSDAINILLTSVQSQLITIQNNDIFNILQKFINALKDNGDLLNYYLNNKGQWVQISFSYLFSLFISDLLQLNQIQTGTNNYVLAMSNVGALNYQLLSDNNISSLSYSKITDYLNLTTSSAINLTWQQSDAVTNPISYFTMFKCVQPSYTKRYEWSINAYTNSTDNVNFYLNYYKNSTQYQILQFNRALMIIWNGCQIYDSLGGVLYCSNSSKITSANANYITYYQLNTECKTPIATLNGYFSAVTNPLYLELHNGTSIQYITDSYINDNTISQSKIINLITDLGNTQPLSTILTSLNSAGWGTNNYILSTNGTNTLTWIVNTPADNSLTYKKLIWQTQPSTINQYQFISYDYTNDKLTSSQYINASTMIADGAIAGAKITNATVSYSKLLTYNNPSDLQFLKYNLTQDKLEYVTLSGSFFSDNTIPYNKLGTKTNNYAFICTDSTHANIIEVLLNSTTNVNNYISSACIDYTRLTPINDTYTITSAYNNTFNINFNNTFSTTNNFIQHNINVSNSTYGVKTYVWKYNAPNANYCTLDLLIDGVNNYFSCTGNTSGIYNGSTYNKGVIVSQWFKANNIISNNTGSSIGSFAPYECLTKTVAENRYQPLIFPLVNSTLISSYSPYGMYMRTYSSASYQDHFYFSSSNNAGVGCGLYSSLCCGYSSSYYILEGRASMSNISTSCYINGSGYFYTGSSKKKKK